MISSAEGYELLVTQTWQVTMVALMVWITTRFVAQDRPHLAHMLWAIVLIKCITPPIWSSPTSPFCWLSKTEAHTMSLESTPSNPSQPIDGIVVEWKPSERRAPLEIDGSTPKALAANQASMHFEEKVIKGWPRAMFSNWHQSLFWMWGGGTLLFGSWTVARFGCFLYWLRKHEDVTSDAMVRFIDDLSRNLGVRRRVRIKVLDGNIGPAVIGFIRPTVLLPKAILKGKTLEQLRPLLAHELIHVRRGDLGWATLQAISVCFGWFHPFIWIADRLMTRESERSCDEETIASIGCKPAEYARGLLEVLEKKHWLRVAPALPGVRPVDITASRLERIMRLRQGSHARTPNWIWSVLIIGSIFVLPGAPLLKAQEGKGRVQFGTSNEAAPSLLPLLKEIPPWLDDLQSETIDVRELIARLKKEGHDEGTTHKWILGMVFPRDKSEIEKEGLTHGIAISIAPPVIVDGKLIVWETKKHLEFIRASVERFSKHGFEQIETSIQLLSVPKELSDRLDVDWTPMEDSLIVEWQAGTEARKAEPSKKPSQSQQAVLTREKMKVLFATLQSDRDTNRMNAPRVTSFNGQSTTVTVGKEHSLFFGYHATQGSPEEARTFEPVIRKLQEGTSLTVTPTLIENGKTSLQFRCQLSHFDWKESNLVIPATFGLDATEETFKLPIVTTQTIRLDTEVEPKKVLAIRTEMPVSKGRSKDLIILVDCRSVDESEPLAFDFAVPIQKVVSNPPLQQILIEANGSPIEPMNNPSEDAIEAAFREAGLQVMRKGNLQFELSDAGLIVKGNKMTIDARNGEDGVKISADYGRLDFGDRDIFNGNVEVLIEGKLALRADQLELMNGKCIAIGNVVMTTPGLSGLRLTADHFMLVGDQIELTKNGHVSVERLSNISERANNSKP